MGGLEDGAVGPDVRPRGHAQPAHQSRRQVAEDVAVKVRQHQHVVQLRLLHQLHAHVVDDAVLELDVGILLGDLRGPSARNSPSVYFMMLALWTAVTFLRPIVAGVLEREAHDPLAAGNADRLDRHARLRRGPT